MTETDTQETTTTFAENAPRRRVAGILLHPTSLPGRFGVGDLGRGVDRFLDWARDAGQSLWQILPLAAPDHHNAPYGGLSAFAGNSLLVSPELLVEDGLLRSEDLDDAPGSAFQVDFDAVKPWKEGLLRRAFERYCERPEAADELTACAAEPERAGWIDDWTLFMALRRQHDENGWWDWPAELRDRHPDALDTARRELADEISYHVFVEKLFTEQWRRVRAAAHERGIRIVGDVPIYVSLNSAEVWTRRELFDLDDAGQPLSVAGVPPDYFSETGQLWGNPLYRWDRMADDGYAWWIERLRVNLQLTDFVRLDHFRGFASYWRVGAGEETAVNGEWVDGPRTALFDALRAALGDLPLIAEDLGDLTPDVGELLDATALPCMRVLQFGIEDPTSIHVPHHLPIRCAAYTGTHDNDTTVGWYRSGIDDEGRRRVDAYCGPDDVHRAMIRLLYTSVAEWAVIPVQDVLGLGSEARMNTPGLTEDNWAWRLQDAALTAQHAAFLRRLAEITDRVD